MPQYAISDQGHKNGVVLQKSSGDVDKGSMGRDLDTVSMSSLAASGIALEKQVGLTSAIGIIVGTIVGSGIFISPTGVASGAGSTALSLILWGVGGIITLFASLSIAELGTMITTSGGEFVYFKTAFANWLAFLWSWATCLLIRPGSMAVIALTCAEYILAPFYDDGCGSAPDMHKKLLASLVILLLAAINAFSVNLAARIQIIFTVAKMIALLIIIIGGIVKMIQGDTEHLAAGFEGTNDNVGEIFIGFYSAMFAYDGWYNLNAVTEEVVNPSKTMPRAILIGIPLVIGFYMMANVSYFAVMSVDELLASPAVAITWARRVIPAAWWIMPVFVAMSTFGACNGAMFTVGRIFMVTAREGHQMEILSMINVKRLTPQPAIIFLSAFAIIYIQIGAVMILIDNLGFVIWMFHALLMISLIVMRVTMKDTPRPYKVPLILPIIVLIFALALVFVPLVVTPQIGFLYSSLVVLAGLIFYFPFVHFRKSLPCMTYITQFFQLLMQVGPEGAASGKAD